MQHQHNPTTQQQLYHPPYIPLSPYDDAIKIPCDIFTSLLAPGYCVTLHRMQGVSLDCEFTLYEWSKYDTIVGADNVRRLNTDDFMTMRYVALSRSRRLCYINIARDEDHDYSDDVQEEENWIDPDWENEEEEYDEE